MKKVAPVDVLLLSSGDLQAASFCAGSVWTLRYE
jgi:hypothetical protein